MSRQPVSTACTGSRTIFLNSHMVSLMLTAMLTNVVCKGVYRVDCCNVAAYNVDFLLAHVD